MLDEKSVRVFVVEKYVKGRSARVKCGKGILACKTRAESLLE